MHLKVTALFDSDFSHHMRLLKHRHVYSHRSCTFADCNEYFLHVSEKWLKILDFDRIGDIDTALRNHDELFIDNVDNKTWNHSRRMEHPREKRDLDTRED